MPPFLFCLYFARASFSHLHRALHSSPAGNTSACVCCRISTNTRHPSLAALAPAGAFGCTRGCGTANAVASHCLARLPRAMARLKRMAPRRLYRVRATCNAPRAALHRAASSPITTHTSAMHILYTPAMPHAPASHMPSPAPSPPSATTPTPTPPPPHLPPPTHRTCHTWQQASPELWWPCAGLYTPGSRFMPLTGDTLLAGNMTWH